MRGPESPLSSAGPITVKEGQNGRLLMAPVQALHSTRGTHRLGRPHDRETEAHGEASANKQSHLSFSAH